MNLFGGIALFFVLAVVIYFIWLWVRTTSLYAILFDTRSLEPTPDNKTIIGTGVPDWKVEVKLRKGYYPRSEFKLPAEASEEWQELYATQPLLFKKGQRPKPWTTGPRV
jgi:hypothetical protein